MAKAFLDTNIIVYANDTRTPAKQQQAVELVQSLIRSGQGVISSQVLQEYANTALTKLAQEPAIIQRQLALLEVFQTVLILPSLVRRAIDLTALYQINYWDAGILAAAEQAGCAILYSEDLNAGQLYSGVRVVNPFAQSGSLE